ncbi:hypothetical protein ACLB2K_061029 [Fragaria x ananassa]
MLKYILQRYRKSPEFDLCYASRDLRYKTLPALTYHFEGADLRLYPKSVRETIGRTICIAVFPTSETGINILGAFQQANHRFLFDAKQSRVSFAPEIWNERSIIMLNSKGRFSYCLPAWTAPKGTSAFLTFGNEATIKGKSQTNIPAYNIKLLGVSIGTQCLSIDPALFKLRHGPSGGFFTDSGTVFIKSAYRILRQEMVKHVIYAAL